MTMRPLPLHITDAGPIAGASQWVEATLYGSLGTVLAVLAVAFFGAEMLTGRISMRRGGQLVLGCFIFFAAPTLARALDNLAKGTGSQIVVDPPNEVIAPPPVPKQAPRYDPYAGASVPNAQ